MSFDYFNDDEVFFGKLSLEEVKYRVRPSTERRNSTSGCSYYSDSDHDSSLKLIEATSEPSLMYINDSISIQHYEEDSLPDLSINQSKTQSWKTRNSDESFIKMECIVAKMCESEQENCNQGCDDTFNDVKRLLVKAQKTEILRSGSPDIMAKSPIPKINAITEHENLDFPENNAPEILIHSCNTKTPFKQRKQESDIFYTPLRSTENNINVFKTPSVKSAGKVLKGSVKKTPMKYDYIKSPVAAYIRDSPHVPLVKDIRPKKPLPAGSAIPKLVKAPASLTKNKENIILPRLAYRSAKETKMNEIAATSHLPKSHWAKNMESALPRPMVIRHGTRDQKIRCDTIQNEEDSFDNLSLYQADVSLCTLLPGTPLNMKK